MRTRGIGLLLSLLLGGCATLAAHDGDEDQPNDKGGAELPNAGIGPFRPLRPGEIGNSRSAPNALFDKDTFPRDVSVLDIDGDPSTFEIAGYAAQGDEGSDPSAPPRVIARYGALDARSFDRASEIVLEPQEAWEGAFVGQPDVLLLNGEVWMYYAAEGGIGLARSPDGHAFTRESMPVLEAGSGGWEAGAVPKSPSVLRLADGSFRMFYEIENNGRSGIGEAASVDGLVWMRMGNAPALEPSLPEEESAVYDGASVGSPGCALKTSHFGETLLLLYYRATNAEGRITIALAARSGSDGPFDKAASPVFGAGSTREPHDPAVLIYKDFSFLFVTQKQSVGDVEPAVAVGLAPALASIPEPNPR